MDHPQTFGGPRAGRAASPPSDGSPSTGYHPQHRRPQRRREDHPLRPPVGLPAGRRRPDPSVAGHDITDLPSYKRAIAGLGRSFQEARLFPGLTVAETVMVGLDVHLANRDVVSAAFGLPVARERAQRQDPCRRAHRAAGLDRSPAPHPVGAAHRHRSIVELACILAEQPTKPATSRCSAGTSRRSSKSSIRSTVT